MKKKEISHIRKFLAILNLKHIDKILDKELAKATQEKVGPSTFLYRLLASEVEMVTQRRIERRVKESKLPQRKLLADFDFDFQTGVDKAQIMELATLSFVQRKQGLILAGSSGTGKSHIAKALMLIACKNCYRCQYTTAAAMLNELISGLADNTLEKKLKKYIYPSILLIDEVGFDRLEQESSRHAALFFKVIDGRYTKNSTILTTNIDFKQLGDYLGDPVITTSIVDRMVHHSIIVSIDGPSYRMYESKKINDNE
jgi:DNA replication protein DnaC